MWEMGCIQMRVSIILDNALEALFMETYLLHPFEVQRPQEGNGVFCKQ